jgi:Peptidase family M28/WD40-like Beta Propeller Repeat
MTRLTAAAAIMLLTAWVGFGESANRRLIDADLAWDRGDYLRAVSEYLALLDGSPSQDVVDAIALQTGELFKTTELTTDGGAPRFSPDGRYLAYEVGRGIARRTRLASSDTPSTALAELAGFGASFSPDGLQVGYLKLAVTPEMRRLETLVEQAQGAERTRLTSELAALTETASRITIREIAAGAERELDTAGRRKTAVRLAAGNIVVFTGGEEGAVEQVFVAQDGRSPVAVSDGEPAKVLQEVNSTGTAVLFTHRAQGRRGAGPGLNPRFGVISLPAATATVISGTAPAFSGDGRTLTYVSRLDPHSQLLVAPVATPDRPTVVRSGLPRLDAPALSPDGSRVAFQMMVDQDWELYVARTDGSGERRLTREIQHDLAPRFLGDGRLLGLIGEARHRRSYVYDPESGRRMRVFHNNTVRTIAPEYEWVPSRDGTKVLIVAERDGDTVSLERGVYITDLTTTITRDELRGRLRANLAAEEALRSRGRGLFAAIASAVTAVVSDASTSRVYAYEHALFDFDSKHITRPGNRLASSYLFETYKSFGYTPELQWLSRPEAAGGQTANVVATLKGTTNPDLVYVVSSHYDSVATGPGADDDSSGTAALLETARLLAAHPQPATIVFASFTGEESGLLGSREFVRRAIADKVRIVGALNNDMVGWANDNRLDNTIRYSNPGIRDIQHAAAMQFSNLITYDALYYKGTDAHAYYEAYGDIVGGIGSYPVLGSPHYHQPHDTLDTINHQLVTEVAKTTAATLMLLASSPSRLADLKVDSYQNGTATLSWTPSPEQGITGYIVSWGTDGQPIRVSRPTASIKVALGTIVAVKAVNQRGLEGWDWAKVTVK